MAEELQNGLVEELEKSVQHAQQLCAQPCLLTQKIVEHALKSGTVGEDYSDTKILRSLGLCGALSRKKKGAYLFFHA